MDEKIICYFLKISGWVHDSKKKEFEQTIRFVFNQLPQECFQRNLTNDKNAGELYSFSSLWINERSLLKFMESQEFLLIKGAYSALGALKTVIHGIVNEQEILDSKL